MSDLISRQAAIDAIDSCGRYMLPNGILDTDALNAIRRLPSAQPDLSEFDEWFYIGETLVDVSKYHISAEEGIKKIRGYLRRMRKPARKNGTWVKVRPDARDYSNSFKCSSCQCYIQMPLLVSECEYDFCPYCGCYNGGERE